MPVPVPKENEELSEYMGRCMHFLNQEKPKMDDEQKKAVCLNTFNRGRKKMQRKVFLHSHISYRALGNALQIDGVLLRPGIYTGLDGVPTKYTEDFIHNMKVNIVGKPIKFAHEISPESMLPSIEKGETVGFWTAVQRNGLLRARGYLFHPQVIEFTKQHKNIGLSMEADVNTSFESDDQIELATDGMLTGGVLIDDPACPSCRVENAREVNLQGANTGAREEKKSDKHLSTDPTAEEFIAFSKDENLAKPTRGAFFDWVEKQMKDSGIPENIIPKAIGVLKRAVKIPYPYPYPKAQQLVELEFGPEGWKILSEYTEYVGKCMKEGKTMEECAAAFKKEKGGYPKAGEEGLADELAKTKAELEALRKVQGIQLEEDITKLTGEIKDYDREFDPTRFLEGQTCKIIQRKMLQKYLEVLKKNVKPIKLQLGPDAAKQVVNKAVEEMFGKDATFESVFEIKEGAK